MESIIANSPENTTIDNVQTKHMMRTGKILLQIESLRKTETGFYCEFSDLTGHIYGTISKYALDTGLTCSEIIKKYQRVIEVSTVLFANNVPLLYVQQSGRFYLIITLDNIIRIISKFDVNG